MTSADLPDRLREALAAAGFTHDGVSEVLGPRAHSALGRNETTPGLRRTTGGSPVETLVRLFLLQAPVSLGDAERALPGLLEDLATEGFLERTAGEVAARLDIRPYAAGDRGLWVVSDLTPGLDGSPNRVGADHVLGVSPASSSLAQLTVREPVARALDLGTGCGVQALHLAGHSERVVATDVNTRALWMTSFNARLNGLGAGLDVRVGSLFEPVDDETFDLVVTNPPFVISPATGDRLVYRDSGLPGDQVVERIVRGVPTHLREGGWCQVLTNWAVLGGRPWEERLGGWLTDDVDAFTVQREVLDPAAYVELWLKDAGLHGSRGYLDRYDAWLSWLDTQGIEGIGFGWVNLRRRDTSSPGPTHAFLDWPHAVEQPVGPAVAAWGRAVGARVGLEDRPVRREDVVQETAGVPGAEDPSTVVLRQQRGLMRARLVDTVEAALVGACDGDLSVGQVLHALAQLLDRDPEELVAAYLPVVRDLVVEGFLVGA